MADQLAIHVPPDSNPENIGDMVRLMALVPNTLFSTSRELIDYLKEQGSNSNDFVHTTSMSIGFLDRSPDGIVLSKISQALSQIREEVRPDLMHYVMYTAWSELTPTNALQSWSYRRVCDQYWEMGVVDIPNIAKRLVEDTINEAHAVFSVLPVAEFSNISFSPRSLSGIHKWMEPLQPEVLEKSGKEYKRFTRREFCPPELLIMAIGYILRDDPDATDLDILLTQDRRDALCRICLLEPSALDRALDWALPTFTTLVSPGTTAGYYGRFIRMNKHPTFEDLIR